MNLSSFWKPRSSEDSLTRRVERKGAGADKDQLIQEGLARFERERALRNSENGLDTRTFNCPNLSMVRRIAAAAENEEGVRLNTDESQIVLYGPKDALHRVISNQATME